MKHATLLIINLERVYTMDKVNGLPVVFQHAFIAVHHDKILAVGCGHWQEYADKDSGWQRTHCSAWIYRGRSAADSP